MKLEIVGGLSGLTCGATCAFGFALLVTLLAPFGFGTGDIDRRSVVGLTETVAGLLILWNSVI